MGLMVFEGLHRLGKKRIKEEIKDKVNLKMTVQIKGIYFVKFLKKKKKESVVPFPSSL